MQTKKMSLIESFTNIAIGYFIACFSQMMIFPLFDIHIPIHQNFQIGLWFTLVSIIRSYTIRRIYNMKEKMGVV